MPATYDEQGNYVYPDGFDSESQEWLEGYEKQREEWEHQYAEARSRYEAHQQQVAEARRSDAAEAAGDGGGDRADRGTRQQPEAEVEATGTLASDEALAALRDKLSGNQN
jgi:small subunit ribosomal protein S1